MRQATVCQPVSRVSVFLFLGLLLFAEVYPCSCSFFQVLDRCHLVACLAPTKGAAGEQHAVDVTLNDDGITQGLGKVDELAPCVGPAWQRMMSSGLEWSQDNLQHSTCLLLGFAVFLGLG